jgi:RES domain-containing protein
MRTGPYGIDGTNIAHEYCARILRTNIATEWSPHASIRRRHVPHRLVAIRRNRESAWSRNASPDRPVCRSRRKRAMSARHNPVDDALDASFPASDPPSHASPLAAVPLDATTEVPATLALYRIVEGHRKDASLAKMIGRTENHWASPEMGLLRMATSIPLAVLDYLVELEGRTPHAHVLVTVRIPCSAVSILNEYPIGWDVLPCRRDVRAAGDAWTAEARCLALRVPSVTCAGEGNVLLNPAHPTAGCIDSFTMSAFRLDPRLRT